MVLFSIMYSKDTKTFTSMYKKNTYREVFIVMLVYSHWCNSRFTTLWRRFLG